MLLKSHVPFDDVMQPWSWRCDVTPCDSACDVTQLFCNMGWYWNSWQCCPLRLGNLMYCSSIIICKLGRFRLSLDREFLGIFIEIAEGFLSNTGILFKHECKFNWCKLMNKIQQSTAYELNIGNYSSNKKMDKRFEWPECLAESSRGRGEGGRRGGWGECATNHQKYIWSNEMKTITECETRTLLHKLWATFWVIFSSNYGALSNWFHFKRPWR